MGGILLFESSVISQKLSHRKNFNFFHRHLFGYNKNWSEQRNDVTKNTLIFSFNMKNSYTEVTISHKIVNKNLKNMAVILSRPTHILYQCAKFGDDRTSISTWATSNM